MAATAAANRVLDPTALSRPSNAAMFSATQTSARPSATHEYGRLSQDDVPMTDAETGRHAARIGAGERGGYTNLESTNEYKKEVEYEYWIVGGIMILLVALGVVYVCVATQLHNRSSVKFFDPEVSTNAHVDYVCEPGAKCARAPARLGTNVSANTRYVLIPVPFVVAILYALVLLTKYVGRPGGGWLQRLFNSMRPSSDEDHLALGVDLPVMLGSMLLHAAALPMMNFTFVLDNLRILLVLTVQQCAMIAIHTVGQAMPEFEARAQAAADAKLETAEDAVKREADSVRKIVKDAFEPIAAVEKAIILTLYVLYALVGLVYVGILIYQVATISDVGPDLYYNRVLTYGVTSVCIAMTIARLVLVGFAAFLPRSMIVAKAAHKPVYKMVHTLALFFEITLVILIYAVCAKSH